MPSTQAIRTVLEAEIFQDPEGGPDSLIVTTDELACEPVVPARLLRMVTEARAQLDAIERLAQVYEAQDTLRAIVTEHQLHLEEWDVANLAPEYHDKFIAFAALTDDGRRIIVVPMGQDPIERVNAVAHLVNSFADEDQA
ncbi:hypothetical protein DKG34_38765 [Streptomyces sp. NWU49]|uniref:hypothetical protein n=1 Tax=Streptomyces sp. NWU49 TaxID=2201153 RepID=UPI000D682E08|nr:hypothetical protein [Streptomyces sp. NWU49]PWJ02420.1 hypothetical protein DKG34_38765 [Streptomyces sp. NWU49]